VDGQTRRDERGAPPPQPSLLRSQSPKTEEEEKQMKTNEFISELRDAPGNELLFVNAEGNTIHAGYHLTELKAVDSNTVDCGGQVNRWQETIVQLWVPPEADDRYMTAAKFLKIFDQVSGMIPLNMDTDIRVEYGDENFFPSTYYVRDVTHDGKSMRVLLEPPVATCKARERRDCGAEACCA
jgi:hypothetical protein